MTKPRFFERVAGDLSMNRIDLLTCVGDLTATTEFPPRSVTVGLEGLVHATKPVLVRKGHGLRIVQ